MKKLFSCVVVALISVAMFASREVVPMQPRRTRCVSTPRARVMISF